MDITISQAASAADEITLQRFYDERQAMVAAETEALRVWREAEAAYYDAKERRMEADAHFHRANGRQQRLSGKLKRRGL